jgi:hypothetical protein
MFCLLGRGTRLLHATKAQAKREPSVNLSRPRFVLFCFVFIPYNTPLRDTTKTSVCFYLYVTWTVEPSNHAGWVVSHGVQRKQLAPYRILFTGPSIALRAQTHIHHIGVAIAKEAQNEGHSGLRATGISRSHVKRSVTQRGAPCVVTRTCDYLASNNDQAYVGGRARSTWGPTSGRERVHCS